MRPDVPYELLIDEVSVQRPVQRVMVTSASLPRECNAGGWLKVKFAVRQDDPLLKDAPIELRLLSNGRGVKSYNEELERGWESNPSRAAGYEWRTERRIQFGEQGVYIYSLYLQPAHVTGLRAAGGRTHLRRLG
ncbi:MAG: hypothetical protein ACUVX8_11890 [Candidatus Zipacnadales bacterium]